MTSLCLITDLGVECNSHNESALHTARTTMCFIYKKKQLQHNFLQNNPNRIHKAISICTDPLTSAAGKETHTTEQSVLLCMNLDRQSGRAGRGAAVFQGAAGAVCTRELRPFWLQYDGGVHWPCFLQWLTNLGTEQSMRHMSGPVIPVESSYHRTPECGVTHKDRGS